MKKPNIVIFGGGSGISSILLGLKKYPINLYAVVSVADDGGSSGIISECYNTPPFGDIRKVLVSLAKEDNQLSQIMNYRFNGENTPFFSHTTGNILLLSYYKQYNNSLKKAIDVMSKELEIKGKVLPVSNERVILKAKFIDGNFIFGETNISSYGEKIDLITPIYNSVNEEVLKAIRVADLIIYSSGSLYTSLIASLNYTEILEEINKSNALKIYVANIMSEPGETDNYMLSDHINELIKYVGLRNLDLVLANNNYNVYPKVLKKYKSKNQRLVKIDFNNCNKINVIIQNANLICIENNYIRHDHNKVALYIFQHLLEMEV